MCQGLVITTFQGTLHFALLQQHETGPRFQLTLVMLSVTVQGATSQSGAVLSQ